MPAPRGGCQLRDRELRGRMAMRDIASDQCCRDSIVFDLASNRNNLAARRVPRSPSSEHKRKVDP